MEDGWWLLAVGRRLACGNPYALHGQSNASALHGQSNPSALHWQIQCISFAMQVEWIISRIPLRECSRTVVSAFILILLCLLDTALWSVTRRLQLNLAGSELPANTENPTEYLPASQSWQQILAATAHMEPQLPVQAVMSSGQSRIHSRHVHHQ